MSLGLPVLTVAVLASSVMMMSEERDNALAIAELRGDLVAVRAETQAMESRIESRIDAGLARLAEDAAKRDTEAAKREAGYRTDIARLAEDAAKRDTEAAKRDTEAAKRETRLILTMVGLIVGAVTILGILIRLD